MVNEKYENIGVEWIDGFIQVSDGNNLYNIKDVIDQLNEQDKRIIKLEKELKDCKKLKKKRLRKIKHQRVVLDELGAAIMGYRGEIKKLKAQINK